MVDTLFRLAVTCIIADISPEGVKYLILQRSSKEIHGKGKWTVAGGTVEEQDWKDIKPEYSFPLWYDVAIRALIREVKEETGLTIINPEYLCDCVFIHKSGVPEIVLSFFATNFSGKLKVSKDEYIGHAWIYASEVDKHDLLIDIPMEIQKVDHIIKLKSWFQ